MSADCLNKMVLVARVVTNVDDVCDWKDPVGASSTFRPAGNLTIPCSKQTAMKFNKKLGLSAVRISGLIASSTLLPSLDRRHMYNEPAAALAPYRVQSAVLQATRDERRIYLRLPCVYLTVPGPFLALWRNCAGDLDASQACFWTCHGYGHTRHPGLGR